MILAGGAIDLRLGDWRTALADVDGCDAAIMDPPFSARTHQGQRFDVTKDERYTHQPGAQALSSRGLGYGEIDESGAHEIVAAMSPLARGWIGFFTSHDLVTAFSEAATRSGRYVFAPLSCVQVNRSVRLAGDGPASWTDHLVVARTAKIAKWGALPGAYVGNAFGPGENSLDRSKRVVAGQKPLWLMRAIIRDYTRVGDLVVDPFCGGGTTALACAIEGRRCITSEIDPDTYEKARKRLEKGHTRDMFTSEATDER